MMKGLQFTPIDVELTPHFKNFTLGDILDTFGLMAEGLEHAETAVFSLWEKAYSARDKEGAKSREESAMSRYNLVCEGNLVLPLLGSHIGALKETALALVEGLRESEYNQIAIPGEKR